MDVHGSMEHKMEQWVNLKDAFGLLQCRSPFYIFFSSIGIVQKTEFNDGNWRKWSTLITE